MIYEIDRSDPLKVSGSIENIFLTNCLYYLIKYG